MDTYQIQFYDLLSRALAPGETIQTFLDNTMALKYNALQLDGFSFEPFMQTDFTFEQVFAEVGLNATAQYYDLDSPALPDGTQGFKSFTGKIPRMKKVEYFNEDKLRKMKLVEDRRSTTPAQVAEIAYQQLFITVDNLIGGHTAALTYQRHQAVSKGKFAINADNNPKGIKNVVIDYHVPADNKNTLPSGQTQWWTS
ncbi:MAG: major capsid protein, partial [Clostridia bacterium]|nr:major capsid protein [Clostridia bacterium]